MVTLTLVVAALMVIAAHAEPLDVLESSYKVLNHNPPNSPFGAQEFSSRAIRTESKRPFEILEQSFKYLPQDSAEKHVRGVVRSIASLTEEAQVESNKKDLRAISRRIAAQDPQEKLRQNNQLVSTSKPALISSPGPARIITTLAPATFKPALISSPGPARIRTTLAPVTFKKTTPVFVPYSTKNYKDTRPRTTQPPTHVNYSTKVERNNRPRTTQPPTFVQYSTIDDRDTRPRNSQSHTYRSSIKSTDFSLAGDRHERVSGPAQPHLVSRHSSIVPPLSTGDPTQLDGTEQHMSHLDTKYGTPFYVQTAGRFDDSSSSNQPSGERKVISKVVLRKVTKSKPSLNTLTTPSSFSTSISQQTYTPKDATFIPPSFVGVAATKAPPSSQRVPVTIPVPTTFVPIHAVTRDGIQDVSREIAVVSHDSNRATNTESQSSNYGTAIPIGGGNQSTSGSDSNTDLKSWKSVQAQTSLEFEDVRPGEVKVQIRNIPIISKSSVRPKGPVVVRKPVIDRLVSAGNTEHNKPVKYIVLRDQQTLEADGSQDVPERQFNNFDYSSNSQDLMGEKEVVVAEEDNEESSAGIISYYDKLKHDIYEILSEFQRDQDLNVFKKAQTQHVKSKAPVQIESPRVTMKYPDREETVPNPGQIDMDEVSEIIKSFRKQGTGKEVPESTVFNIAQTILKYINHREGPGHHRDKSIHFSASSSGNKGGSSRQYNSREYFSYLRDSDKKKPKFIPIINSSNFQSNVDFDSEGEGFDYHYVYYDEMGNEYLPEYVDLFNKHKMISPSDEFTKAFLSKHTSKLSAMLSDVLKSSSTDSNSVSNPVSFKEPEKNENRWKKPESIEQIENRWKKPESITYTKAPSSDILFSPINTLIPARSTPSSIMITTERAASTSKKDDIISNFNDDGWALFGDERVPNVFSLYSDRTRDEHRQSFPQTTTQRITTTAMAYEPTTERPTTTSDPPMTNTREPSTVYATTTTRPPLATSPPSMTTRTSTSRPKPLDVEDLRYDERDPETTTPSSLTTTTESNDVFIFGNQLFRQPLKQSPSSDTQLFPAVSSNKNRIVHEDRVEANTEVLPHPGAGNTALETLAGAGAVALMAYGISYALPLAAPLLLRRSDGGSSRQSSPMSRLMNWLDSRTGGSKRRRPHRRPLHSMAFPLNATEEGGPLANFYDSYDYDKPETLGGYDGMTYEHDKSRPMEPPFREDFEESDSPSRVFKDPEYPFNNPFNEVSTEFGDGATGSVRARADTVQQAQNHVGPEYHSFGFDPLDGAYGDDPTNESHDFGKVTYEYDFTNTHINPAVVGTRDLQQEVQHNVDKVSSPGLGEKADVDSPSKAQDPHRSRPARKPKPRSSNFISDFFNSFRSRVPNHIASRRNPRKPQHQPAKQVHKPEPKPHYQSHLIPSAKPQNTYRPAPAPQPSYQPAPKPAYKPAPRPVHKPMGHRPPAMRPGKQVRPHPPRKQRRPMRGHKARPKMDVGVEGSSEDYAEDKMDDDSLTYVSLEQVNRLAEEEMEGVVRGYNRRYEAPWPPSEGSQAVSESPDQQEAANVLSFGEADASTGRHLNLDSTDYIYRSTEKAKKASQGRVAKGFTMAPDYSEFDYVDIQGSSADVDGRRSRSGNKSFQSRSQSQHGVTEPSPGRSYSGMKEGYQNPSISTASASRPQPVSSFHPSARSRSTDSVRSVSSRFGSSSSGFVPSNPGSSATSSGFVPAVPPHEQFNRRQSRNIEATTYSSALDSTDLDLQKQYWLGHQNPVQIS